MKGKQMAAFGWQLLKSWIFMMLHDLFMISEAITQGLLPLGVWGPSQYKDVVLPV